MNWNHLRNVTLEEILKRLGDQPPAQALYDIAEATKLVGERHLPDVPAPRLDAPGAIVRDLQLKFATDVLQGATQLAEARKEHPAEGIAARQVEFSGAGFVKLSGPIYDHVRALHEQGFDEHVVLGVLMYAAGAIAAQMCVVLPGNAPLKHAIPPLWMGWEKGREMLLAAQQNDEPKH